MAVTLIWDLDGTIIDSYKGIVTSIMTIIKEEHLIMDKAFIESYVKRKSVNDFFIYLSQELNQDFLHLKQRYSTISELHTGSITTLPNVEEVLMELKAMGIKSYIFTHKGSSTTSVLETLGMDPFFDEIVTSANGFQRKPHPEAIHYLMDKYHLLNTDVYYVGDRDIDVMCARNAKIKSILINSKYTTLRADGNIHDVKEILDIVRM